MTKLSSFSQGDWHTAKVDGAPVYNAVNGEKIFEVSSEGVDFKSTMDWARKVGGANLRAMSIHQRALMLKSLAQYLMDRKEELYSLSPLTGATRRDSWIDIEGGVGTLFTYASKGRRELADQSFHIDGAMERLSPNNTFAGQHICVPLEGVALHINAFNFPCWGMLEKLGPTFLGGMPAIVKPASNTSFLARKLVEIILESKILPEGALQIICGSAGDSLEHLCCQDVVTFTGSKQTGVMLRSNPNVIANSVRFNMESDSLNCAILGPESEPGTAEYDLFIKELVSEMTVKAGQKCTAVRRAIVPKQFEDAVIRSLSEGVAKISIGDPGKKEVKMGPLVSKDQVKEVRSQIEALLKVTEKVFGGDDYETLGADKEKGAFLGHHLLHCKKPTSTAEVHEIEAFGPVSTIMGYQDLEEAIEIARLGDGSLCASIFTANDATARKLCLGLAPYHGRLLLMNAECAGESTGHGSPLPHLVHGGPGRAGGGEELGGVRSVFHYMQRTAIQASPTRLSKVCNQWMRGADVTEDVIHPFRKYFDELKIGESLLTHRRTITEADITSFAALSGDFFYAHVDEISAKESIFEGRVAHGYLVLSIAAGLFVSPAPGPVIANYGLENLRFIQPVYIGDTIQARLTCKEKIPKDLEPKGVVAWDVDIINQIGESVALYTILTLVKRDM